MNHLPLYLLLTLLDLCLAPRLYHVDRFVTDRATIREMLSFNRQYKINVSGYRNVYPDSRIVTVIEKECDELWKAWDSLDDAKNEMFSVSRRRQALGVLLKTIGPEAFMRGEMPPHVPLHRFVEVRACGK